ncbi:hypothetical protein V8D89_005486 [Ganoderma adspersum]
MTVWLITGASTGFGRELAEIVLENGDIAIATARRPEVLADLVAKYPADRLLTLKLDVTKPQDILDAFAAAKAKFGRVDVVANNAGYATLGEAESMVEADMRAMFETNFWGATNVSREAVRVFREVNPAGAGGRLLQFSSMAGLKGSGGGAYYCATKFALEGFSEALTHELDPAWNIKVTLIEPGVFATNAFKVTFWAPPHPAYSKPELQTVAMRKLWQDFVPYGDSRKAMEAVYKLASLEDPPLHIPLGKDAVGALRTKVAAIAGDADKYESWSEGLMKTTGESNLPRHLKI